MVFLAGPIVLTSVLFAIIEATLPSSFVLKPFAVFGGFVTSRTVKAEAGGETEYRRYSGLHASVWHSDSEAV